MRFVRGLWRFLVGVKDALVLIFLLLFILALWSVARLSAPTQVPSGTALVLDLDGVIVDQARERSPFMLATGGSDVIPEIEVRDVIKAIDRARDDRRVKTIVLQLDNFFGSGEANLQSIGAALKRFRASGKPIYAYATTYIDDGYYLAAHANEIWVNPLGSVLLTGPGGPGLYFKNALDKLNVDVNVFRVGTYKAAVEPFTRTGPSPEARAADQALVDTLWDSYTSDVAHIRPAANIDAVLADLPERVAAAGGDLSKQAVRDHLVDKIGSYADFGAFIRRLTGAPANDVPGGYNQVSFENYMAATEPLVGGSGPAVGVVYVSGTIIDGEAPPGTAGGDTIADLIEKAMARDNIKALVVRIDSPGGSVMASEKIRQALATAKAKGLPIVASMGDVAASGGYWVASAADEIWAEPATITGSIGVFAIIPTFQRALGKLGVNADGVRSTPYSGEPDMLNGLSPETRTLLQVSVEDIYRRFLGLVSTARKLPVARVDQIAQGRVWAGGTAHQLGLVDHLGGLDAAVAAAAKRAGLKPDVRTIDIEVEPFFPLRLLNQFVGGNNQEESQARDPFAKIARASQLRAAATLAEAAALPQAATMQARCLGCAAHLPPRPLADLPKSGWVARLLGWMT